MDTGKPTPKIAVNKVQCLHFRYLNMLVMIPLNFVSGCTCQPNSRDLFTHKDWDDHPKYKELIHPGTYITHKHSKWFII